MADNAIEGLSGDASRAFPVPSGSACVKHSSAKHRAIVTGVTGQDGSYLAELLLKRGYEVHGVTRSKKMELGCSQHLAGSIVVHCANSFPSVSSGHGSSLALFDWERLLADVRPREVYHFAADSFIPSGWDDPIGNLESNAGLTLRILEAIRKRSPDTKLLNACSREIFGSAATGNANELTELRPHTPYGINKAAARWTVNSYRERYGMFAANAILFNHESPRRGPQFVTRKITKRAAEIWGGLESTLELGNLQARRDWGFAGDYVEAMWRMLQLDAAEDFVIGTGVTHSIEEFASLAFSKVDLNWRDYVTSSDQFARANDSAGMTADITKARQMLDWSPEVDFEQLVAMMVDADTETVKSRISPAKHAA